jgi:hypothetical protein
MFLNGFITVVKIFFEYNYSFLTFAALKTLIR